MGLEMADRRVDGLDRRPPHRGIRERRRSSVAGADRSRGRRSPPRALPIAAHGRPRDPRRRRAPFRTPATPTSRIRRSGSSRSRRRPARGRPLRPSGHLRRSGTVARSGVPAPALARAASPPWRHRSRRSHRAAGERTVLTYSATSAHLSGRCPSAWRAVKPVPNAYAVRPAASDSRWAIADAVVERVTVARDEHARAEPDPLSALGRQRQRHPHVELQRRRVVDPGPLIAELLGVPHQIRCAGRRRQRTRDLEHAQVLLGTFDG